MQRYTMYKFAWRNIKSLDLPNVIPMQIKARPEAFVETESLFKF